MSALHDEELCQAIDSEVPRSATHVGIVLHDVQGNVVVRQAKTPKFGVTASIPRWRLDGTEPSVALKQLQKLPHSLLVQSIVLFRALC